MLTLLLDKRPFWAEFVLAPAWTLWFNAAPPDLNGLAVGTTRLEVGLRKGTIFVAERAGKRRYPSYCPERHINEGGPFCLGLDEPEIQKGADAVGWWSRLHHFLVLQAMAEQTGAWPSVHAYSHGAEAARNELDARTIAEAFGLTDDYNAMLDGEANWLEQRVSSYDRPAARKPIPRSALQRLIEHERARRRALQDFWRAEIARGRRCCGTMNDCPLKRLALGAAARDEKRSSVQWPTRNISQT